MCSRIVREVLVVAACCLLVTGCSQKKYERLRQLEHAGYYYSNTGSLNRSLWRTFPNNSEEVVPRIIIDIDYVFPFVTLIRQKLHSFSCGPGNKGAEITDEFEYWIVNVVNHSQDSFGSYSDFEQQARLLGIEGEQLLHEVDYYRTRGRAEVSFTIPCDIPKDEKAVQDTGIRGQIYFLSIN